jgi:hypothetical protein
MGRWIKAEEDAIREVRKRLYRELTICPQFPEGSETSSFP